MIIPREVPFKEKIHSYYLIFENFVASMQEEIGSGCIYCRSIGQEHIIYFNDRELLRCVVEERGQAPRTYRQLGDVIQAFKVRPFIISVHYLDNHAVYFWGQLPPYRKTRVPDPGARKRSLGGMVDRYKADRFSGFFDVTTPNGDGGLIFLQDGTIAGGSYAWGQGGLSASMEDYQRLVALYDSNDCTLAIGAFTAVAPPA